jgi:hypothetical protein
VIDREARSFTHPVEIRASVECVEQNQQRALQEVTEEWKVRGVCITKRSGPRAMWVLGIKRQLAIFWEGLSLIGGSNCT